MPLCYFVWKHVVYDAANQEFSVFCDIDSEPGLKWTLVHPFSLENTDIFRGQRFGINLPLNFDSRTVAVWVLSPAALAVESIGRCIEYRCYRCNLWLTTLHNCKQPVTFPPTALKNRLRARQAENSRLFRSFSYQCLHYEYINIRCGASVVKTAQQQQSRETLARGPLTATRVKQNSAATSMAPLV